MNRVIRVAGQAWRTLSRKGGFFIELGPVFARERIKDNPRGNVERERGGTSVKESGSLRRIDRRVYFFRNIFSNGFN